MPAFIANGPDIPERLLQAHEDGRVVFFCGAGISYPAGLPGFDGLVRDIFSDLNITPNAVQQAAIKAKRYDTVIGLLEADIVGSREKVRAAISRILTPNKFSPTSTATQEALLTLARNRDGRVRLITTNFDRLFEHVIVSKSLPVERFKAPLLPIPKNNWDGLVYLHGLLPSEEKASEFDCLVASSGDFGLAYLTERWAARFVSTIFRNYIVCFVGYSINDPVLRYMTDALAADQLLGESPPEMFAFGCYAKGKENQVEEDWRAKNVTPILYQEHHRHKYLHHTLREWAKTYRDGVQGKEMIIVQHASTPPLASSRSDFAVGRVLWALTDSSAARRFAELNPVPSLKWLEAFSESMFEHQDLSRFGVIAASTKDENLCFSLLHRPTAYSLAPWMCLVRMDYETNGTLDDVMKYMAHWLTRHLNDPELLLWLAKQGGRLHESFARTIRSRMDEIARLEKDKDQEKLDCIIQNAPNAIPSPKMRTLWRILLAGRVSVSTSRISFYDWIDRIHIDGVTSSLRMELREILAPSVKFSKPFRFGIDLLDRSSSENSINDFVDWELTLPYEHVHSAIQHWAIMPQWQKALPVLLPDFTLLLRDAMDLARELDGANDHRDPSYIDQPSIGEHPQNKHFQNWTVLIELVRDAWLEVLKIDPVRASRAAMEWWQTPCLVFKRLAMFAAAQDAAISNRQILDWLSEEDHWWLWSVESRYETIRLLIALAPRLTVSEMSELGKAIMAGPPRRMFKDEIAPPKWTEIVEKEVWLRLAKIQAAGVALTEDSHAKLKELSQKHSDWKVANDGSDEMTFWVGGRDESRSFSPVPRRRRELMEWLKSNQEYDYWEGNDWRQRCRDNFCATVSALFSLSKEGVWPKTPWAEALQAWSEEKAIIKRSWRYIAPLLENAPEDFVRVHSHGISWWLKAVVESVEDDRQLFFILCNRILSSVPKEDISDASVTRAINHPVGLITEALLSCWYQRKPQERQGLPQDIKLIFTNICNDQIGQFLPGRIVLARHAVSLYRVDLLWTKKHFLPLFDWTHSSMEARGAWGGFFSSAHLHRPFLSDIKKNLLETALHYNELDEQAEWYTNFMTFVALDPGDTFTPQELAETVGRLPEAGLIHMLRTISRALDGAGEQRGQYWENRVYPFMQKVWPKVRDLLTSEITDGIAQLCVGAGDSFPKAVQDLEHWLQSVRYLGLILMHMREGQICEKHPKAALAFLNSIVGDNSIFSPDELSKCLNDIEKSESELASDRCFIKLKERLKRYGMN